MNAKVLLISNSYPYSGEPFLKTEIGFLPKGVSVDVWPFFVDHLKVDDSKMPLNTNSHVYRTQSAVGKLKCLLMGMYIFLREKEYKATCAKKNPLRNVIKAIKFAYISEIRLSSIWKWIVEQGNISEDFKIYSYWMYETAYVGARLKTLLPNSAFITRCHGYDLYEERHPNGYLPFRAFILKNADRVCPISNNGYEYLRKLYGSEITKKIYVSRLGTIRESEVPVVQKKEEGIVLVSCSSLVEVKRVHLIIYALKKCDRQIIWYHFGDGELRESIEEQAKDLPKNIKYRFMGYTANEDVHRFYANHYIDAFVNVSRSEGIPVSVMEAESYGIPIIATDVGGTSEIVHDKGNGVLLKVDFTDEDLMAAIDDVVTKADQYRTEALHTWQTLSDAHVEFPEFYKKLAEV